MTGRLADKVALITGATSGIGEATAELFAAEGAKVVVAGRSQSRGQAIAERIGNAAFFVQTDVTRESELKAAVDSAVDRFGRLDILFNNAGGPAPGEVEDVTEDQFQGAMALLLGSVVFGIKYAAPIMRRQGRGAIINNSSVAGLRAHMGGYLYSVAKAGVTHATKLAGMQLGQFGVTVNSISPGAIVTPIFLGGADAADRLDPESAARKMEKLEANLGKITPLLRAGHGRDIAYAALFLASDEGAYVNCHDLVLDGGMTFGGRFNYP